MHGPGLETVLLAPAASALLEDASRLYFKPAVRTVRFVLSCPTHKHDIPKRISVPSAINLSISEQFAACLIFAEGNINLVLHYCKLCLHPEKNVHVAHNFHTPFQHLRVNKRKLETKASKAVSCNNLFKHCPSFGQFLLSVYGG